jgi:hypothetical protein
MCGEGKRGGEREEPRHARREGEVGVGVMDDDGEMVKRERGREAVRRAQGHGGRERRP